MKTIGNTVVGKIVGVLLTALFFSCLHTQAAPVTGNITFADNVTLDTSSADTATAVNTWGGFGLGGLPQVQSVDGDLASFVTAGDPVTFHAPWSFTSGAIPSFWSVDGFTFDLSSSSISNQGSGAVAVTAVGTISGNSFDPTLGTFHFTTQDPSAGAHFSFSAASAAIPEPATMRSLLSGSWLLGAFMFMRRRRA